ncbi:hypothetical protein [Leuconostoc fallax]|uniref:hypothetical protein n=1 Tax=Leuconostoc fallax TaxID=1251 RepID=UPI001C1E9691|nr:hypothetical protein [Leuconostoc fallax]MBU7455869.1 hypothetical protein [Leuconostoc fallax]
MSNKEEYKKAAAKAITLLAKAECLLSNALLDPDVEDSIEYEYFIEGIKFQGAIRAALESNSSQEVVDPIEGSVSYSPLSFDYGLREVDLDDRN